MKLSNSLNNPRCPSCGLNKNTSRVVVSRGAPYSKLMLIGEAPGAKEDEIGKPFVGRSGKLLNIILEKAGFDYEKDVFICNLLKSRPPNNRTPTRQEIQNHIPWLYQQIKLVDPLIIVLIGSTALRAILGIKSKISDLRGTWHNWNGIYVMPIFHPAYLLRNPSKSLGAPYDLTCLDLHEVNKKLFELQLVPKNTSFTIPMSH